MKLTAKVTLKIELPVEIEIAGNMRLCDVYDRAIALATDGVRYGPVGQLTVITTQVDSILVSSDERPFPAPARTPVVS